MSLLNQLSELDHLAVALLHHPLTEQPSRRKDQHSRKANLPVQGKDQASPRNRLYDLGDGRQECG